jgi:hypothetical protein
MTFDEADFNGTRSTVGRAKWLRGKKIFANARATTNKENTRDRFQDISHLFFIFNRRQEELKHSEIFSDVSRCDALMLCDTTK